MSTLYIVQRLDWQYNDNWYDIRDTAIVKAFRDPDLAELYRRDLEAEARRAPLATLAPAGLAGGLHRASSITQDALVLRLDQLRIPLPPLVNSFLDWEDSDWWKGALDLVSRKDQPRYWKRLEGLDADDPRAASLAEVGPDDLWALFDRTRFYEVVPVEWVP